MSSTGRKLWRSKSRAKVSRVSLFSILRDLVTLTLPFRLHVDNCAGISKAFDEVISDSGYSALIGSVYVGGEGKRINGYATSAAARDGSLINVAMTNTSS